MVLLFPSEYYIGSVWVIQCIDRSFCPYRFLTTLEDNAVNENEPDEGTFFIAPLVLPVTFVMFSDLDVTHLQLLLFVWHNFSLDTRKKLLLQCVTAVVKVAEEKKVSVENALSVLIHLRFRSGVVVPPVPVCRLLLVLGLHALPVFRT